MPKKETSAYASGRRELSGTVISWGQSPISRACLYPQGPEKVFVHECVTVCVHMCGCVNVYTQVFICTCASTHGNVVCIHIQLCVRACVCVPVFKIWTPTPLSPCPMLTSTKAVSLSYRSVPYYSTLLAVFLRASQ